MERRRTGRLTADDEALLARLGRIGANVGANARALGAALRLFETEIWPRQVSLARAFGWGPAEIENMDLADLEDYVQLADDFPDALPRMRAFSWTSIAPASTDPKNLRMWLEGCLGPPMRSAEGAPSLDAAMPDRRPRDTTRERRERLKAATQWAIANDGLASDASARRIFDWFDDVDENDDENPVAVRWCVRAYKSLGPRTLERDLTAIRSPH